LSFLFISPDQNRTLSTVLAANKQLDLDVKAAKIDAFFAMYGLPMEGKGQKLVEAATENGLSPYEIAVVSIVESTGGKFACPNDPNNAFGWNSCHGAKFKSMDDAIDTVAKTISGNNPKTASYYAGKDFNTRFQVYNGYANDQYITNIKWAIRKIDSMPVKADATLASL
jgi:hypothetical protein